MRSCSRLRRAAGGFWTLLAAALDGSGPAILPLDPGLPWARLQDLLSVFAVTAVETTDGTKRLPAGRPPAARRGWPSLAARPPAWTRTSRSWWRRPAPPGVPKGVQLTAAALRASAAASLDRIGAGPGRALAVLPAPVPRRRAPGPCPVDDRRDQPGRDRRRRRARPCRVRCALRVAGPDPAAPAAGRRGAPGRVRGHPARRRCAAAPACWPRPARRERG